MEALSPPRQSATQLIRVPKLKDSCTACANSKVKCSKDKPKCARCTRKKFQCTYDGSKRTARVSQAAFKAAEEQRGNDDDSDNGEGPSYSSDAVAEQRAHAHASQDTIRVSTGISRTNGPSGSMDSYADIWSSLLESGTGLTPAPDLNNFVEGSVDELITSLNDSSAVPLDVLTAASSSTEPQRTYAEPAPSMSPISESDYAMDWPEHMTGIDMGPERGIQEPGPSTTRPLDCCLTMVTGFLLQLHPRPMSFCTLFGSFQDVNGKSTVQSIVQENKDIIERLTETLDCTCSQDEYLLTLIGMVVFKLLDWYSAAVRDSQSGNQQPGSASGRASLPQTQAQNPTALPTPQQRAAARLVLREFHLMQQLVNLLSCRWEAVRLRNHANRGRSADAPALSAATSDHLESDLRKRLRGVSCEIIDVLRPE